MRGCYLGLGFISAVTGIISTGFDIIPWGVNPLGDFDSLLYDKVEEFCKFFSLVA